MSMFEVPPDGTIDLLSKREVFLHLSSPLNHRQSGQQSLLLAYSEMTPEKLLYVTNFRHSRWGAKVDIAPLLSSQSFS